jgi:hypothetical protein
MFVIPDNIKTTLKTEFNKDSSAILMHYLKHLNRRHVWHGHIPVWRNGKWDNGNTFKVFENNGSGFNERFLEKCGFNITEVMANPLWKKYTLLFITYNENSSKILSKGLSDSRDEILEMYFSKLCDAVQLKTLMEGGH